MQTSTKIPISEADIDRVIKAVRKAVGDDELRGVTLLCTVLMQALYVWTNGTRVGALTILNNMLDQIFEQIKVQGHAGVRLWYDAFSGSKSSRRAS